MGLDILGILHVVIAKVMVLHLAHNAIGLDMWIVGIVADKVIKPALNAMVGYLINVVFVMDLVS